MNYTNYMLFAASLLICTHVHADAPTSVQKNEVLKVFHHRGDPNPSLVAGKVTLYFKDEPVVKQSEVTPVPNKPGFEQVKLSLPNLSIHSGEAQEMIGKLNASNQKLYSVMIAPESSNLGIEITITYDAQRVMTKYMSTIAIKHEKVLEIVFYDKQMVNSLGKEQSVIRYSCVHKPTIIIDCGHGGTDAGTIGCFKTQEKNITLAVGNKLKKELEKQDFRVLLTRVDDRFVPLDERTTFANRCKGDVLLISLHANNAGKESVSGLETYCLGSDLFKSCDYQLATAIDVIIEKVEDRRYQQGQRLAECVHKNILKSIKTHGYEPRDRKVKKATAQILSGINCPGILVEMDFLSNPEAARCLATPSFQEKVMAHGICSGIIEYLKIK